MTQLNKGVLFVSCVLALLLLSLSGCGSSSTETTTPTAFLFAGNSFRPGSMAAFTLSSGTLGHIDGSPFVTSGNAPYTLAVVSTKFLYAGIPATQNGGVITRVLGRTLSGSVTGGIMLMPLKTDHTLDVPQMFARGGDYDPIAVTPGGNFLYAADLSSHHLAAFSIDSTKGTLTAIGPQGPPPGVAAGPDPFNVVVDPQGKFVFVANCDCRTNPQNQGSVQVFSINADGTLNTVGTFVPGGAVTAQPIALAVSPDSKFLFVASLDDKVYVESIASGTLTDVAAVPLQVVGSTPVSIAVSSDGKYLYTGNAGTRTISFFAVDTTTGNLTPRSNTTVGGAVGTLLPDPAGGFLYVTDYDHGFILVFSIGTDGTLTQSGSVVNTGGANPFGLAIAH